jgi:putative endonuclease
MSNESRMLYVGVTNDLHKRVFQHKSKLIPAFTQRYNL